VPKIIVADENEGRRNLLAGTLERSGYEVTRAGTLRQAEGTALATMPEIVLMDGEWQSGDAIDAAQRLMGDPEFAFKCRIVMLSRDNSPDYLAGAARAGISEVISKPVDMNHLISQLEKHSKKQFVAPPADVSNATGTGGGGSFDVGMVMGDGSWALPVLKGLVSPEKINVNFINEILQQLGDEGITVDADIDPGLMSNVLRVALNNLVTAADESKKVDLELPGNKKGPTLGSGKSSKISMEEILQNQADDIAFEVGETMDQILSEKPDFIAIVEDDNKTRIDPAVLEFTRLVNETIHELMWDLGRPGTVTDLTLLTRIEDGAMMLADVLESLPQKEEEE
jgi:CheY-like chemotaxis protein